MFAQGINYADEPYVYHRFLNLRRKDPLLYDYIHGPLSVASKYDVAPFLTLVARHIEADWPKSLEEWHTFRGSSHRKHGSSFHITILTACASS